MLNDSRQIKQSDFPIQLSIKYWQNLCPLVIVLLSIFINLTHFGFIFESFVAKLIYVFLNLKLTIIKAFIYHHRLSITNRIKKTRLSLYCYKMVNKNRSLPSVLILLPPNK